jgi:hypothetical protein
LPLLAATGFSTCALAHNLAPIRLRACIYCAQALRKHIHGLGNELHSRSAARVLSLSGLPSWRIQKSPDELALLQPTPGYMRLLKESVLQIWKARKATVREEIATAERTAKAIQDKLDRLDEAFLFERSIDIDTYDRHAEKLREELTLARMDRHSGQLDELDVEGIVAFAERVLPRAADLWVQASLEQRQRFQQLFFRNGIAFDGNRFVRTGVTAPVFNYLREIETGNVGLVDLTGIEPVTS